MGEIMNKSGGSSSKKVSTKRQALRDKRRQQQQRQRLLIIFAIVGAAIVIAGILIVPSLLPAGDIVTITPSNRPTVDGRSMGDPNAPVVIEVFEDFQCPSCQNYSEQIEPQVIENFVASGQVYYTFRHFPFLDDDELRKESDQAANASMCAAEQNKFWDYHDIIFANQTGENVGAYTDNRLIAFAEAIDLDMDAFNSCFEDNSYEAEIQDDLEKARSLSVTGTPGVFVDGQIVAPGFVPTYDQIAQAVEAALAGAED
jgi:protein-disulfide isomerase